MKHFDLSGQTAFVVGPENPAGEALAAALLEAGALVRQIEAGSPESVASAIDTEANRSGPPRILAVGFDSFVAMPLAEFDFAAVREALEGNFLVQFAATQAAARHMVQAGQGGRVILTTSVLGERGVANSSVYSAAQGAVVNFVRASAQELAPAGITVNAIELGWMEWMQDRIDPTSESANRAVRFTMQKRAGTQADIGPMAVWLAGSGSGFVTGQLFPLDGGLTQHL